MGNFISNIEAFFKSKSLLSRLITINIAVFIVVRLMYVIGTLFNANIGLLTYLEVPSSFEQLLFRPWTLITYMFTHFDFFHILFNMLWLYWFGNIFLIFFNSKQLSGLYILGGIAGALLFILSYNIFPYFRTAASSSYLIGASASVMAIVFAGSFYKPEFHVNLLILGKIKIIYLAIITLIIDILAITSTNAGGHIAHIGGALIGIGFAQGMKSGKDITSGLNFLIDKFFNLFKKRTPQMRVKHKRAETDYEYNGRKNEENKEIDQILDKIKKSGYNSLTKEEKNKLFNASKK